MLREVLAALARQGITRVLVEGGATLATAFLREGLVDRLYLFEVPLLALVNPLRWELGHVTFFYEAFLLQLLGQTKPLLVGAEDLYDSFKIDHDDRWSLPLPSRQQTLEYMQRVLDAVVERLQGHDPSAQETYLYLLSVLHEDMHGEALTYMRQTLSYPTPQLGSTPAALEIHAASAM